MRRPQARTRSRRSEGRWLAARGRRIDRLARRRAAWSCGHCVEDRIAAVYDHALVQRAAAARHQLAYFAWDGPLARGESLRRQLLALAGGIPGVDKGGVRVSMEPAAIAVAFDPRRADAVAIAAALQKKLRALSVEIVPLQAPPMSPAP